MPKTDLFIPFPDFIADALRDSWPAGKPMGYTIPIAVLDAIVKVACQEGERRQIDPTTLCLTIAAAAAYLTLSETEVMRPMLMTSAAAVFASGADLFGDVAAREGLDLSAHQARH